MPHLSEDLHLPFWLGGAPVYDEATVTVGQVVAATALADIETGAGISPDQAGVTMGGVSTPGTVFTPADLAPSAWWRADDLTGSEGDPIASWPDASGNGHPMEQITSAQQGQLRVAALNGFNGVEFTGYRYMDTNDPIPSRTIFVVVKHNSNPNFGGYERVIDSADAQGWSIFGVPGGSNYNSADVRYPRGIPDSAFWQTGKVGGANANPTGTPKVLSAVADGLKNHRVTFATYTGGNGKQNLNGAIFEAILYDTALTDADRQKVEGHLAWKYGLEADLPVAHPYRAAAPGDTPAYVDAGVGVNGSDQAVALGDVATGMDLDQVVAATRLGDVAADVGFGADQAGVDLTGETTPGVSWTPMDLSPSGWWAADTLVGADASSINTWPDLSGNGADMTKHTAAAAPTVKVAGLNGMPVAHFTEEQAMNAAPSVTMPYSVFALARHWDTTKHERIITAAISRRNWFAGWWRKLQDSAFDNGWFSPSGITATTNWLSIAAVGDGSGGKLWRDGTFKSAGPAVGLSNNLNLNSTSETLADTASTRSNESSRSEIAEVLIFPVALGTDDRQKVEGYLAWKYGLQANLPSGHPYLNGPPGSAPAYVDAGIGPGAGEGYAILVDDPDTDLEVTE